jgi:hypothetical protein
MTGPLHFCPLLLALLLDGLQQHVHTIVRGAYEMPARCDHGGCGAEYCVCALDYSSSQRQQQ